MNETNENQDPKDQRRKKFQNKNVKKHDYSDFFEEQRYISKSKKERRKKIEDIRGDEIWEDWENQD